MAGGKSTRMGRDKSLLKIAGIPMWQRQLGLLTSISSDVLVVAPTRPEWLPGEAHWVADEIHDGGPMGGLATALAQSTHRLVLILAIDMPGISGEFLERLSNMMAPNGSGIIPQIDGRYEPLSAFYPRTALPIVKEQIFRKNYSLQTLVHRLVQAGLMQSFAVKPTDLCHFRNLNRPSDCTEMELFGDNHKISPFQIGQFQNS
jgi:molybdopterin-guanine dinucleotide biosynthesis protein A